MDTIGGDINYFVRELYGKGFASDNTKSQITSMHGVGGRTKADILLEQVHTHFRNARDKKLRFGIFVAIFSKDAAYQDLALILKGGTKY